MNVMQMDIPGGWKPHGDARLFPTPAGDVALQYVRGTGGRGAHAVVFPDGRILLAQQEAAGVTTGQKRSKTISDTLRPLAYVARDTTLNVAQIVVGALEMAGATNWSWLNNDVEWTVTIDEYGRSRFDPNRPPAGEYRIVPT